MGSQIREFIMKMTIAEYDAHKRLIQLGSLMADLLFPSDDREGNGGSKHVNCGPAYWYKEGGVANVFECGGEYAKQWNGLLKELRPIYDGVKKVGPRRKL